MSLAKSQIGKKVLSWALIFALVVSFTPNIGATHEEDDTINVENAIFSQDGDGLHNDLLFLAHNRDDGLENITINVWKKNAIGNWEEYDDGETDEDGELDFYNVTSGEYMWDAYDGNSKISNEGGFATVDSTYLVGHAGILSDGDDDGDYDDFVGYVFGANGTSDEGYVEIYGEDGDLIDDGYTDEELDDNFTAFLATNLQRGNYTHYIYEEYDGTLIHNGSFYSYGSYNTTSNGDSDEWFESWDYDTQDTNGDDVANYIEITFDPNTDCNCSMEVEVVMEVYNNDTESYVDDNWTYFEINGTEEDEFDINWIADVDGNLTFTFRLFDDEYNWEDEFSFTHYMECDENEIECEIDEWFEDYEYETEDTGSDNLDDTINVKYNPDTECDCEVNIYVELAVFDNATGNWVDYVSSEHRINGTEEDSFTQSWTSRNSSLYDFELILYDEDWDFEDSIRIPGIYLYQATGAGGPGDEDEYFDWFDDYTWDSDDDGYDDTIEIDFDADTTCECNMSVTVEIDVYDNETGAWVNGTDLNYTIYYDDDEYKYEYWSPEYNGTFDFYVELYDESNNLEEELELLGIELNRRSDDGGGNETEDSDEWFEDRGYYVEPSKTINIEYNPDTSCVCEVRVWVYIDVYQEGNKIDTIADDYYIYHDDSYLFEQNWTANKNDTYDFKVVLFDGEDGPENYEDEYWIYDVYLGDSDDNDTGGGDEDHDEWFSYMNWWQNWAWDMVELSLDMQSDCECDMDVYVEVEIWDENWNLYDVIEENYTLNDGWAYDYLNISLNQETGIFTFNVTLYDNNWKVEDQDAFRMVISDEWFEYEYTVDDSIADIMIYPYSSYEGDSWASIGMDIYKYDEQNNDWENIEYFWEEFEFPSEENRQDLSFHFSQDLSDRGDGEYRFDVIILDENNFRDHKETFYTNISSNAAPVIHGIYAEQAFEGQMVTFKVDVTDEDGDNLEFNWDMGDGTLGGGPWGLHDESIMYVYPDNGEYVITVQVSDGNGNLVEEEFTIFVFNENPSLDISYDDFGQEGQTITFASQTSDVLDDTVKVTWTFPDGTQEEGNFAQYLFADDGDFIIGVTAEDEDGGETSENIIVTIENVAPTFTEFQMPSGGQEGETLDFKFDAVDPGQDTIVFNINFGDGTLPLITQDGGNISHRFADGDTFTITVCAKDEDGGESCRQQVLPISILEELQDEGLLPGFSLLVAISALGVVGILRRRAH